MGLFAQKSLTWVLVRVFDTLFCDLESLESLYYRFWAESKLTTPEVEPAFAFMEQLVWLIDQARKDPELVTKIGGIGGMTALLKIMSSQYPCRSHYWICLTWSTARALEKCAREAQQIFGGLGYSRGGKGGRVEQISRDARMFVVGGGSDEIMTELALKQETNDLKAFAKAGTGASKL
jgi:hypothetical protein